MRTFFYIIFLSTFSVFYLKASDFNETMLFCNWKPSVNLPERMKVFGLIFGEGQVEMLGIDGQGEVRGSDLGPYTVDATNLSWEGAPLFGRNMINRQTLTDQEGILLCERSKNSTSLKLQLEKQGKDLKR